MSPIDVILRDGATLRLRSPVDEDAQAIVEFFAALSAESRFMRFHGLAAAGERFARTIVEPNWEERGALVAVIAEPDEETIVAIGNYVRLRDHHTAEAAFAVNDRYQGQGVGTRLLEQLASRAAEHAIDAFVAEVLPDNRAMLSVFENVGFRVTRTLESGVVEVRFPIAPTDSYRARVDERDHIAVTASLQPFFEPRTVAVIGASARRGSIGGELFRNVLTGGFTGAAYPVNRSGEPVAGVRAYTSIEEITDPIDLCVICLPGDGVLAAAEEVLRKGTRALCVISAGFAEIGPEGRERQEQLIALIRAHGARLVGPNCLGIASAAVGLNATFAPRAFPPGRIGFSSQSGALGLALLERAEARGLGISAFVSIGNKADVSSNDLLEWWEDDDDTDLVLMYLESFGNPGKFARIARRLAREKPVLAMKSGRSRAGRKAAGSHTAALAGSDTAVDALFRQAGVIRAETLAELLDVAALLSSQPIPRGRRVAVLTNAGGLGILCADACEAAGLELPQLAEATRTALAAALPAEASVLNPVDMLGSATAESFYKALPVVLADPGIDAAIALFVPPVAVEAPEAGAHKTETGGVALDLQNADEVRAAATRIGCPVIVQPMITGGVELLAGVAHDLVFGPLVAFGPGGVLAELIGDAHFRLTPLTDIDADELVRSGKAGRLIAGFRGAAPADGAALADVLHRLSQLADDLPELAELDLNPVIGLPGRAVVVDARVRVARPQLRTDAKSW